MRTALIIILAALLGACASTKTASPFSDEKGFEPLDWPNVDLPFFIFSAAAYYHRYEKWAVSIPEIEAGSAAWIESVAEEEKKELEKAPRLGFAHVFSIKEVIQMRGGGVAYRLVYKKNGHEFSGLIMLDPSDSADAIVKSAKLSEELGAIMNAVPF